MRTSETVNEIQKALVTARKSIENLAPSAQGYGYNYIPLAKIIDHLKNILPSLGLGYIQLPALGGIGQAGLTTRIIHISGEWIEETAAFDITDMKGMNKSQGAGAALTYFRRYSLCAAFGITGDDDTDASNKKKDEPISFNISVESWIEKMTETKTVNELRAVYEAAYETAQTEEEKEKVIAAKDKRKKELTRE